MDKLRVEGAHFVDSLGREVLLRGVNLSGSSKMPITEPTHLPADFSNHRQVSFTGRPFPLEEADEHYQRLRHWGFNVLRFIITWEAIEHEAPGQYDTAYLDYLTEVITLAEKYGFYVFIDPHQDVWSRMTGGDGAPGWTLEAAGFDISKLDASEAAITMQRRYPDYPVMIWTNNYLRLACNTLFTLFFAGNQLAPGVTINGTPLQDFLQNSFINAVAQVAQRIKDMPHVLGYGSMNEPGKGYIGLASLNDAEAIFQQMIWITPADSILLGAGFPRKVPRIEMRNFKPVMLDESVILNPDGISAWKQEDLWHQLGVWDFNANGQPEIKKPDYFAGVDFLTDGLMPFVKKFAQSIRRIHPDSILFLESTPTEAHRFTVDTRELGSCVNASHRYDELMLFTKTFTGEAALDVTTQQMIHGRPNVAQLYRDKFAELNTLSQTVMGGIPTLIGEFGIMFDMNGRKAYQDGDFSMQELALSMHYDALDSNLIHSTQWNYTPDNNNQWGDTWNLEDLSIFSRDQQNDPEDIHSGGRAVRGFCRPYVQRAAGKIRKIRFDWAHVSFETEIEMSASAPTLIYVPDIWYGDSCHIEVSSGTYSFGAAQQLVWENAEQGLQTIRITKAR